MIELSHVDYDYPGGVPALRDISLSLDKGHCYAVQGPNGCGKSTLFRILLGLAFPDAGTYRFGGEEITARSLRSEAFARDFHRRIGFVFQDPEAQLFCSTVEDELLFGPAQTDLPRDEALARTEDYLSLFGLREIRKRAPFALSGGEKKRVALASALILEPEVLILDEPLAGLDEDSQELMADCIRRARSQDRLILCASHDRAFTERTADMVIRMGKNHRLIGMEPVGGDQLSEDGKELR